jgi:hypothetical protein
MFKIITRQKHDIEQLRKRIQELGRATQINVNAA